MKITKIEIAKYKSIKKSAEIKFCDGLPTVLIGKNGSGKTNILEALNIIYSINDNPYGNGSKTIPEYKIYGCLQEDDIKKIFPESSAEKEYEFTAYSGNDGRMEKIESKKLVPLLKSEIIEIEKNAEKLNDALEEYENLLAEIEYGEFGEHAVGSFKIIDSGGSTTEYAFLKSRINFALEQAKGLAESFMKNCSADEKSIKFGCFEPYEKYLEWNEFEKLNFKLEYKKPDFAPFEKKYIKINEEGIKEEIENINRKTEKNCEKINNLLHELAKRAERMKAALSENGVKFESGEKFFRFVGELKKCIGTKCMFLRNESSEVIFEREKNIGEYYVDKSAVILRAYLIKSYKGDDPEIMLKKIREEKDFLLPDDVLKGFEKYLNENRPNFESGMYERISVERSGGKIPSVILHENGGEKIALNSTSAGRRWYFTYLFIKNVLEPGDVFIIDEPAAMLHPLAQKEVLKELLELEKGGIKVIYTTHSPYLVPNEWECVNFVSMKEEGTTVTRENEYEHLKQITGGDIFDLQELLERYQKCGSVEAAHSCYKALIKKYGTIEEAANNVRFGYDTIEAWKKKKRGTLFENVIKIANILGVSPKELL